jgi:GNAT superfamily N-acetyltransferase
VLQLQHGFFICNKCTGIFTRVNQTGMTIENSTPNDIEEILGLYSLATAHMKTKGTVSWPVFERALIETEIAENRQWKITIEGATACVWATTFNDPQIWEERNADPAVYIHRIATNPLYRGQNMVLHIVEWAKQYANNNGKQYIRMDTVGNNTSLISHYTRCGFSFLGLLKLQNTAGLPAHYDNATVSLFEIDLNKE